jgi:hypothetical protein
MRLVLLVFLFGFNFVGRWIDGRTWSMGDCRDAGKFVLVPVWLGTVSHSSCCRIVEYATREQAQQAIQTLSNQSLMGRLVYVREVCKFLCDGLCRRRDTDFDVMLTGSRN